MLVTTCCYFKCIWNLLIALKKYELYFPHYMQKKVKAYFKSYLVSTAPLLKLILYAIQVGAVVVGFDRYFNYYKVQ